MWAGLGLALILCLLPGGGAEHLDRCKEPPEWNIGEENPMMNSRGLGDLQLKLANNGMVNISFIVVNHQGNSSQLKYQLLRENVPEDIPVYQPSATQLDVWTTLRGKKDDFLIYDRCGRLVYHLGLPVSFLSFPFVEKAIQMTYCEETCGNCSYTTSEIEEICKRIGGNPEEKQIEAASASQLSPSEHPHPHHPHHHHGHHRHHHGHHPHHHPQGHHHRGDHQHLTAINNQPNHRVLGQEPADAAFLAAAVEGPLQGNRL